MPQLARDTVWSRAPHKVRGRAPIALLIATVLPLACSPSPHTASHALLRPPTPPPPRAIESTEPWQFESTDGRLIRTRNYRLFTTDTTDLQRTLPPFLELALHSYTTSLTPTPLPGPDLKLDTFLMADRSQWSSLTRQVMGIHAGPYLRIQRGGFASGGRALLFSIGPRDTLAIAAHEGWHQYTQRTFKQELPLWLEEGLAAYMEGFIADPAGDSHVFKPWANPERFEQLSAAARNGTLMPLTRLLELTPASLLSSDTDAALTYYAQTWALVHFLHDTYPDQLARALHDAAAGNLRAAIDAHHGTGASLLLARERRGPELLTTYFNIPDPQTEYGNYLAAIIAGSKDRILAGQSPFEN